MPSSVRRVKRLLWFFPFWIALGNSLFAQEVSYDRYAPVWPEGPLKEKPSPVGERFRAWGTHFLVYPFEFVRRPVDETLLLIETYHLEDKVDWIYDQMKNRGLTPRVRSLLGGEGFGGGLDLELVKLFGLKDRLPNLTLQGSALWTLDSITDYRVKILQDQIAGMGLRAGGNFKYENRGEEHFYGIGPNTSLGDGTSYRLERTTLEVVLGQNFFNTWDWEGKFAYENANVTNGEDGGRGIIDEIFVATGRQRIPGLAGDRILSWALELEHDNRDSEEVPTEGGYERFHFSFNKGLESTTGFFKYRLEAAHFFKLFSDRRILALRGLVEHNDEVEDREVPFFEMSRLGGYGIYPRYGEAQRGYRRDRFYDESLILFNFEYRWNAWEYREWRMDPALFFDVGQVFGEWSRFQFKDFRVSYGLGFRVSYEKEILLAIDFARSNEGFEFYVKTKAAF